MVAKMLMFITPNYYNSRAEQIVSSNVIGSAIPLYDAGAVYITFSRPGK